MDVQRDPAILKRKRRRQIALAVMAGLLIIAVSVAVSRLEPASPSIPDSATTLWYGTVKRGSFTRDVRGAGTLVPEEIRWITATTSGRVENVVLQPGASVKPGTVIIELSNPDLEQQVRSAELDWKTALAQLANQRATIATTRVSQEAAIVDNESAYQVALADLEMYQKLAKDGLAPEMDVKRKQAALSQAKNRLELSRRQLASSVETAESQIAPSEAAANQKKAEFDRLSRQLGDLKVKSTMTGRLQEISVQVGQSVGAGINLARVSDPNRLKAEIRISETQTRDLSIGLIAEVDTRSGKVKGHVSRIDPASRGGTVGVDVILDGPLPPGARPDLGVDGTIELERLTNVLYVDSPAFGQENGTISLFKVLPTNEAVRTNVKVGRRAVSFIEVVDGLREGEKVVLSDMSQYDAYDKVKLN